MLNLCTYESLYIFKSNTFVFLGWLIPLPLITYWTISVALSQEFSYNEINSEICWKSLELENNIDVSLYVLTPEASNPLANWHLFVKSKIWRGKKFAKHFFNYVQIVALETIWRSVQFFLNCQPLLKNENPFLKLPMFKLKIFI